MATGYSLQQCIADLQSLEPSIVELLHNLTVDWQEFDHLKNDSQWNEALSVCLMADLINVQYDAKAEQSDNGHTASLLLQGRGEWWSIAKKSIADRLHWPASETSFTFSNVFKARLSNTGLTARDDSELLGSAVFQGKLTPTSPVCDCVVVSTAEGPTVTLDNATLDEKAVAAKVSHPEWTDKQIADHIDCHVQSLYKPNMINFKRAKAAIKAGRNGIKSGTKYNGEIEAVDG